MKMGYRQKTVIKVLIHLSALSPFIYLLTHIITEQAGGDPTQWIIHYTGFVALNLLMIGLTLTPLTQIFKQAIFIQNRRLIGLYAFFYATLHLFAFIGLDLLFIWSLFLSELPKRPYMVIGMVSYLLLFLLAVSSLPVLKRKMKQRWQQLHNGVYFIIILVPIHYYWSIKSELTLPIIYIIFAIILLSYRAVKRFTRF